MYMLYLREAFPGTQVREQRHVFTSKFSKRITTKQIAKEFAAQRKSYSEVR